MSVDDFLGGGFMQGGSDAGDGAVSALATHWDKSPYHPHE